MAADELVLGRIAGIFGVRGEVRLLLFNLDSSWLLAHPREVTLRASDGRERVVRLSARPGAGKRVLGTIPGVTDREQARDMMGWEIIVPRSALPPPGEGEWYIDDLLGAPARTTEGRDLGVLKEIHTGSPVDVWEFSGPGGSTYLPGLVENLVDVSAEAIVVLHAGVLEGA